ncbi:MAG TPA: MarC family protein [Candidatus Dormibacteraeota bacterium]|nr:MarC family protein [Candidatus Dormibacteraeota bacterium]
MLRQLAENLITLFVVIDPIGSIPIFLNATRGLGHSDRTRVALVAVGVSLLVLMVFLYGAQYALEALHTGIPAFRIAGALVLFLFALQMIFSGHHQGGEPEPARTPAEIAIFPVAMPGIASPGALLAVVLLTDNNRFSLTEQSIVAGLTVGVLVAVLVALLFASRIQRLLGTPGIMVVTQIMGLVLASFSVQQVIDGVLETIAKAGR